MIVCAHMNIADSQTINESVIISVITANYFLISGYLLQYVH